MSETISSIHIYTVVNVFFASILVYFTHSLVAEWTYVLQQAKYGWIQTFPQAFKRVRTELRHYMGKNDQPLEVSFSAGDFYLLLSLTCVLYSFSLFPFSKNLVSSSLVNDKILYIHLIIPSIIFISYVSQIFAYWIDVNDMKMLKVIKLSYEKITEIFIILSIVFIVYLFQTSELNGGSVLSGPISVILIKFVLMVVYLGVLCAPNSEDNRFFSFELGGRQNVTEDEEHYQRVLGLIIQHLQDSILILLFIYLFLGGGSLFGTLQLSGDIPIGTFIVFGKFVFMTLITTIVKISLPYELSERIAQRRIKIVFPLLMLILLVSFMTIPNGGYPW